MGHSTNPAANNRVSDVGAIHRETPRRVAQGIAYACGTKPTKPSYATPQTPMKICPDPQGGLRLLSLTWRSPVFLNFISARFTYQRCLIPALDSPNCFRLATVFTNLLSRPAAVVAWTHIYYIRIIAAIARPILPAAAVTGFAIHRCLRLCLEGGWVGR